MEVLKPSLNMSNQFQSSLLNDPINMKISNVREEKTTNEIHPRFASKDRISKERDYIGSYKIPSDTLKKRTNPTEEFIRQKEEELRKTKAILEEMERKKRNILKTNVLTKSTANGRNEFTLQEISDLENMEENEEITVKDDLLKVLDTHVGLLQRKSREQIEKLSKNKEYKSKLLNNRKIFSNEELEEPDVDTHFMAANNNRVQTLKHVQTQHKPEYIPLEELEKMKMEHEQELMDIEDEYYGRKKIPEEELRRRRELRKKLERQRQLNQMIQRPGYNNDNPLEPKDIAYINKFGNYLKKKSDEYDKLGYEEEWNNTRIKSLNANGLINRTDGLPGDLDIDDYKLYYYDISDQKKPDFERPLLVHPHTGKESSYKKTFRNEPGYEDTMGKMYRTMTDTNNYNYYYSNYNLTDNKNNTLKNSKNFNVKNLTINTGNEYDNINNMNNINPEVMINQSLNMEKNNKQNNSFIKMIFKMMPKNSKGKTLKNRIAFEMKLDENIVKELGFEDKDDFEEKLSKFKTKEPNYMSEEEFMAFLINKGQPEEEEKQNEIKENQLYSLSGPNFYKNTGVTDVDEILPGMSTTTFDFLKNPSTKARLKHVNKVLGKKSKSSSNILNRSKKGYIINKNDYIYYKDRNKYNDQKTFNNQSNFKNTLNHSFDSRHALTNINNNFYNNENNIPNNNISTYNNTNPHFNVSRYNKKSDINFTVPEPFDFLKKNYHEKKMTKIQEILEERKKNEDEVFNHHFQANPLNRKMFDQTGNLKNVTDKEKEKRDRRIELKKNDIIANMRPFSFYDKDFESFVTRKNQECIPPKFVPFKANPIKWRSQVKMYDGMMEKENARKERNQRRAEELLNKAALPPRMEMHEKHKKLQAEEDKKMEKENIKREKERRLFKAKNAPDFQRLHEKFIHILEKKKRAAHPTVPEPFTFHEPKKKADLCNFLNFENDPKAKNPKKNKSIEKIRKTMHKKPKMEPATTKSLTLLMETRRKELEMRKKREEDILREDEQRIKKQKDFNERVWTSAVMVKNKEQWKKLNDDRKEAQKFFKSKKKEQKDEYKQKLEEIKQRVNNRPLMMEDAVRKKNVSSMQQDKI